MSAEKILVVDDEIGLLDLINMVLEREGYQITTCSDPLDVEDLLAENRVDLIITDFMMPHKTGFDIAVAIKEKDPDIKIIMCSADIKTFPHRFDDWERKGYIDSSIAKPYDIDVLFKTVRAVLDRKPQSAETFI